VPLKPGKDPKTVSANISELTHHGSRPRSHKQIVAIALENARRHPYAGGGKVSSGPPDYTNKYNTKLTPEQEAQFLKTYPNARDNFDYDMRGAWLAGANKAANGHYPDTYKKPNHPTFSTESKYNGVDGYNGGQWQPNGKFWNYIPSQTNLNTFGYDELQSYFKRKEPDSVLVLPKRAGGGSIPKRADGGLADYPTTKMVELPNYMGLEAFTPIPGTNNLPYAIQEKAVEAAQRATQLPPLAPTDTASSFAKGGNLKFSGGVGGVLKLRPPHSLSRVTEPKAKGGFIHSSIPGRTDRLAMNVRHGSHVIPADVVSGLGQGNSLAGARNLDMIISSLPQVFADGGNVSPSPPSRKSDHEPILAAGGEYIIDPEDVRRVGHGDQKKGHKLLDKMIVNVRRKEAKRMLKLPPPKK